MKILKDRNISILRNILAVTTTLLLCSALGSCRAEATQEEHRALCFHECIFFTSPTDLFINTGRTDVSEAGASEYAWIVELEIEKETYQIVVYKESNDPPQTAKSSDPIIRPGQVDIWQPNESGAWSVVPGIHELTADLVNGYLVVKLCDPKWIKRFWDKKPEKAVFKTFGAQPIAASPEEVILANRAIKYIETDAFNFRKMNLYEGFYKYMAFHLGDPELCEKISDKAATIELKYTQFSLPSDDQITLAKSLCYDQVAYNSRKTELCAKVLPTRVLPTGVIPEDAISSERNFSRGRQVTSQSCIERIKERGPNVSMSPSGPRWEQVFRLFGEMGYELTELYIEGETAKWIDLADTYRALGRKEDLKTKLAVLLEHDKSRSKETLTIEQTEFLYDMAALTSNNIKWCKKIREDVYYPMDRYSKTQTTNRFREYCILKVASNNKNQKLCDELSGQNETQGRWRSLKDSCMFSANPQHKSNTTSTYIIPKYDEDIKRILNALEVPLPSVNDIPMNRQESLLHYFIISLDDDENADAVIKRKELIGRIKQLPDF